MVPLPIRIALAVAALAVAGFMALQLSAEKRLKDSRDTVYEVLKRGDPRREDAIRTLLDVADVQPGTEALLLASSARCCASSTAHRSGGIRYRGLSRCARSSALSAAGRSTSFSAKPSVSQVRKLSGSRPTARRARAAPGRSSPRELRALEASSSASVPGCTSATASSVRIASSRRGSPRFRTS